MNARKVGILSIGAAAIAGLTLVVATRSPDAPEETSITAQNENESVTRDDESLPAAEVPDSLACTFGVGTKFGLSYLAEAQWEMPGGSVAGTLMQEFDDALNTSALMSFEVLSSNATSAVQAV